jgi:hypothetical protein
MDFNTFYQTLGLVYYLNDAEALRPYLGISYTHSNSDSSRSSTQTFDISTFLPGSSRPTVLPQTSTQTVDEKGHGNSGAVFFGAQHAFGHRVSAYAQAGVSYGSRSSDLTSVRTTDSPDFRRGTTTARSTSHSHSNDSGSFTGALGIVFYLR